VYVPGSLLVVDDDDDIREATRALMEKHGWDVVAVGSGSEALAYLAYEAPDLVLLDLHMDDMNGWEVIGMVRSEPRLAGTEIVVVTGSDAAVTPPTRVLRKPFKIEALLEVLGQPPSKGHASSKRHSA
jgi:CheY-like chemotaxis protein